VKTTNIQIQRREMNTNRIADDENSHTDTQSFERIHSTGGIIIHYKPSCKNPQSNQEFLNNDIALVKGCYSVGLPKPLIRSPDQPWPPVYDKSKFRGYSFPKGHIEENDTSEIEAAYREIWEESGIPRDKLRLISKIGAIRKDEQSGREIRLYLFSTVCLDDTPLLDPVAKDEILEARWASIGDLLNGNVLLKSEFLEFLKNNMDQIRNEFNNWLSTTNQS
jgi:ADP-ribose pyrophosphatase YjhB (NUDIX family)